LVSCSGAKLCEEPKVRGEVRAGKAAEPMLVTRSAG
jgi:hypothetical protein